MDSLGDFEEDHDHPDPYGTQYETELLFYKEVFDFENDDSI